MRPAPRQVPREESVWIKLGESHDVQLRFALHKIGWNRGFDFTAGTAARVARLRARLVFEIYADDQLAEADDAPDARGDWRALRDDLSAAEGSFLLKLRAETQWDAVAFRRLTREMFEYVRARAPGSDIPSWAAEGFWYLGCFAKNWSQHPNFLRPLAPEYYEDAYERLHNLAFWLFQGTSPYEDPGAFERPLRGEPTA